MTPSTKKIFSNPFLNYLRDFRREMQGQNVSVTRLCQLAGQRRREMTPEQRMPYIQLAEKARKIEKRKRGSKVAVHKKKERKNKRSDSPLDSGRRKKHAQSETSATSYSSDTSGSSNG